MVTSSWPDWPHLRPRDTARLDWLLKHTRKGFWFTPESRRDIDADMRREKK